MGSLLLKWLLVLSRLSFWNWVAVIYASQFLGSLFIIILFGLSSREMIVPMLVLLLGVGVAILFGRHDNPNGTSPWRLWLPVLLYALFIFLLSHKSFQNVRTSFSGNFFHPVEFATLGLFLSFVWYRLPGKRDTLRCIVPAFGSGFGYALFDEFHQYFVPGRSPSFLDLALDGLGLSLGCGAFLLVKILTGWVRNHKVPGS